MGAGASSGQQAPSCPGGEEPSERPGDVRSVRDPERARPGVPRHVRVLRRFLGLEPFYHHGVDLGDGRVAHYCKSADIGGGIIGQVALPGNFATCLDPHSPAQGGGRLRRSAWWLCFCDNAAYLLPTIHQELRQGGMTLSAHLLRRP